MIGYPCPQYPLPLVTEEAYILLQTSLSEGVRRVKYADKEVEYHSVGDMLRILQWMAAQLNPCGSGRPMKVVGSYVSGLHTPLDYPETSEIDYRYRNR